MNWWLLARESVHRHMAISSMQISKAKRAYLGIIGWFVVEGLGSSQRERVWVHWENVKMLLDFWRMCSLLSTFCVLYIIVSLCNRPTFISYAQTDCSRHHSVSPSPDMNVFKLGDSSYYRWLSPIPFDTLFIQTVIKVRSKKLSDHLQTRGPGLAFPFQIKVKWHNQWTSLFCKSAVRQTVFLHWTCQCLKKTAKQIENVSECKSITLYYPHQLSYTEKSTVLSTLRHTLLRDWTEPNSSVYFLHFCMSVFHGNCIVVVGIGGLDQYLFNQACIETREHCGS